MPGDSSVHSAATIQKVPFANCGKIRRLIPIDGVSTRPSDEYGIVKPSQGGIYARVVKIEQTPRSARRSSTYMYRVNHPVRDKTFVDTDIKFRTYACLKFGNFRMQT